jgi:predicted Rdx family selenoprotein
LKKELNVEATLVKGHSGIFEIAVAGKVVASKGRTGFPSEQHVVDSVSKALGPAAPGS